MRSFHHFNRTITVKLMLRLLLGGLFHPLNHAAYITQTAGALWVSQITGALPGIYPCVDVVYNRCAFFWRSSTQITYGVTKAVA
jgi:hypothetical protein